MDQHISIYKVKSFTYSMREERTNDSDVVLGSLELPEGNIDGDTTLTLGL